MTEAQKKTAVKPADKPDDGAVPEEVTPEDSAAVTAAVDHDRVAMLSVKADGTPDQNDPEFVGDKEDAAKATREQFRQQAVSAVDGPKRAELGLSTSPDEDTSDAKIDELKEAHDAAAAVAEERADSVVESLTSDKQ